MKNAPDLDRQREALCEATNAFLRQNFGILPNPISVLMDQVLIVIRVGNFLCPAEIEMGKGRKDKDLIHEMYSKLFNEVKAAMIDRTEQITRKEVISSQMSIDLETEVCVMSFFLSQKPMIGRLLTE